MLRRYPFMPKGVAWILGLLVAGILLRWSDEGDGSQARPARPTPVWYARPEALDRFDKPDASSSIQLQVHQFLSPARTHAGPGGPLVLPALTSFCNDRMLLLCQSYWLGQPYDFIAYTRFIFEYQIAINAP